MNIRLIPDPHVISLECCRCGENIIIGNRTPAHKIEECLSEHKCFFTKEEVIRLVQAVGAMD